MRRLCYSLVVGLALLTGCGDGSDPTGPAGGGDPVFDQITVSLDDCRGSFQYTVRVRPATAP